jgi:hypothetical protein
VQRDTNLRNGEETMFKLTTEKRNPGSKLFALMRTICLLAVASFMATTTWAQSSGAHFQNNSVSAAIQPDGDLVVSWVEAGLGNANVTYSVTADVSATYFCVTNSGNIPNASNKHVVNTAVSTGGSFESKNGKVTANLVLEAPPAPVSAPPTCGSGQTLELQSITWSNVVLTDTTNNVMATVTKGTFTITLFPAP